MRENVERPEGVEGPLGRPKPKAPYGLEPKLSLALEDVGVRGMAGVFHGRGEARGLPDPMTPGSLPGPGEALRGTDTPPRSALWEGVGGPRVAYVWLGVVGSESMPPAAAAAAAAVVVSLVGVHGRCMPVVDE